MEYMNKILSILLKNLVISTGSSQKNHILLTNVRLSQKFFWLKLCRKIIFSDTTKDKKKVSKT